MIQWVFFDVGNLLFNDHQQAFYGYTCLFERIRARHPEYTFSDLLGRREFHAAAGKNWILFEIAREFLPPDEIQAFYPKVLEHLLPNYDSFHRMNDGVEAALESLHGRYRLGIIANQPPECRNSLDRRRLLRYFDVIGISEELDLHKPDAKFFEWALEQAGCSPQSAVMIGDRLDNDVAPARQLGMRTILLRWPADGSCWRPTDDHGRLFVESCKRVPYFNSAGPGIEPDRIVSSFAEIPPAVDSIAKSASS